MLLLLIPASSNTAIIPSMCVDDDGCGGGGAFLHSCLHRWVVGNKLTLCFPSGSLQAALQAENAELKILVRKVRGLLDGGVMGALLPGTVNPVSQGPGSLGSSCPPKSGP